MNNKSSSKVLSTLIAIFAIVAIFVEYAAAFYDDDGTVLGSVFTVMFGVSNKYATVWPLVIAFVALLLGFLLLIGNLVLSGKGLKACFLAEAVLFIGAGVLFLFGLQFFEAANPGNLVGGKSYLGAGSITTAVFAFLAGASALGGLLLAKKDA
jgi:hypothetical protein